MDESKKTLLLEMLIKTLQTDRALKFLLSLSEDDLTTLLATVKIRINNTIKTS